MPEIRGSLQPILLAQDVGEIAIFPVLSRAVAALLGRLSQPVAFASAQPSTLSFSAINAGRVQELTRTSVQAQAPAFEAPSP